MLIESYLPPSGPVETPSEVSKWVESVARALCESDSAPYKAFVWPYRLGAHSFICCDIDGIRGTGLGITFKFGRITEFDEAEPVVQDAAEALHWVKLLTQTVGADVHLRRKGEVAAVPEAHDIRDESDEEVREMEARRSRLFRIHHRYDIGDQSVYVRCTNREVDVQLAAAFIVAKTEEWWGNVLVSNLGVAAALVEFYDCEHLAATPLHTEIDLYDQSRHSAAVCASELERAGLRAYIRRHVSAAGSGHMLEDDPHAQRISS